MVGLVMEMHNANLSPMAWAAYLLGREVISTRKTFTGNAWLYTEDIGRVFGKLGCSQSSGFEVKKELVDKGFWERFPWARGAYLDSRYFVSNNTPEEREDFRKGVNERKAASRFAAATIEAAKRTAEALS